MIPKLASELGYKGLVKMSEMINSDWWRLYL